MSLLIVLNLSAVFGTIKLNILMTSPQNYYNNVNKICTRDGTVVWLDDDIERSGLGKISVTIACVRLRVLMKSE